MIGGLHARGWHGGVLIVQQIRDIEIRENAATEYDYRSFRRKARPQ
jgi:hypothetical protein